MNTKVEPKVLGAAVATAVTAVVAVLVLLGLDVNFGERDAEALAAAVAGVVGGIQMVAAFVGGYLKRSETSAVSEGFRDRRGLRDGGYGAIEVLVAALLVVILVVVLIRLL